MRGDNNKGVFLPGRTRIAGIFADNNVLNAAVC